MTLTAADMLNPDYNFEVELTLNSGGVVRTISARDMLSAGSMRSALPRGT